jgi:hypothetical protein
MYQMLEGLGYNPTKSVEWRYVLLGQREEIRRYYREIGTRNSHHVEQYVEKAQEAWGIDVSSEVWHLGYEGL